ncbi:CDP-glucose 4,6-dehydratase [Pokkaliibacter plantistimulans]|uniref:CDP-glucose 4,6-dehydratase n=1 Tax=Pokkaliibacter plantistimulans TaxID=1635171 RepID=A0ABX5M0D0_9GAMM|nr:CDP-glucose 4,6-dehydratase [Pokkaliibacter plantistimulans]PXF32380.1 CDP-glucose 4,6-dehydratase [Pokkaliibacter plantistimulans]
MGVSPVANSGFWRGKRVLVTGHTGFKGSWLTLWLARMGAQVTGVALKAESQSLFVAADIKALCQDITLDIRDLNAVKNAVRQAEPDIVFHLAAQALVRESYRQPVDTSSTNIVGTVNVLEALRGCPSVKSVLCITTDKVYHNREWPWPYRESDALGGHDIYSASKAACELMVSAYRSSFFAEKGISLVTARAGNVIGGGDWSADRLIPDAIRAWSHGDTVDIRRPDAVRPWQHVLDCLNGYLIYAEHLSHRQDCPQSLNFGPDAAGMATVREVISIASGIFDGARCRFHEQPEGPHEAGLLMLDPSLARQSLGVHNHWRLEQTLNRTMLWYKRYYAGESARALCEADIAELEAAWRP